MRSSARVRWPGLWSRRARSLLLAAGLVTTCAPAPTPAPPPIPAAPPASPAPTREEPLMATPRAPQPAEKPRLGPALVTVGLTWDVDSLSLSPVGVGTLGGAADGELDAGDRLSIRVTRQGAAARVVGRRKTRQYTLWPSDTLTLV